MVTWRDRERCQSPQGRCGGCGEGRSVAPVGEEVARLLVRCRSLCGRTHRGQKRSTTPNRGFGACFLVSGSRWPAEGHVPRPHGDPG